MARALRRLCVLAMALLAAACTDAPRLYQVSAQLPPLDGRARIFVYRIYNLSQSLEWVPVSLNGTGIGGVGPGHVLVCDVPPGTYTINARSEGLWPNQSRTVAVAAGQDVYAEIGSFRGLNPASAGGASLLDTFVVMLRDTATGRLAVAQLWYRPCQAPFAPGA